MDDRAGSLLKVLIERYIDDGQPVGSRALAHVFDLSPATIRNIMADLEELGLIHSPHTSAGRVPTSRGYRFFVDSLLTVSNYAIEPDATSNILNALPRTEPKKAIAAAAHVLSGMTQFAGVVMASRRTQSFKQLEFIRLSEQQILLVIVTPEGDIQNRILKTHKDFSLTELADAARLLNQHFSGRSFKDVRQSLVTDLHTLQSDITLLMEQAVQVTTEVAYAQDEVLIAGERNLLHVSDLTSNMDKLRAMFQLFEQKTELMHLLDLSLQAQGVQIYIGGDSGLIAAHDMSVVTAPYHVDGKVVGTLGVIGPTRMAYDRVIPMVDITASLLSHVLTQG